jgi:lipopolysaccharide transport system permease protein
LSSPISRWAGYEHYRDLVLILLAKDLKVRYRGMFLGYAWSVLHPLAFTAVLYVVFKLFVRIDIENYTLFLVCGLFPWQWIANSASSSTLMFVGNSSLIKKVLFPRLFLVAAGVLNDLVHFVLALPVIMVFVLWTYGGLYYSWTYQIPPMLVVTFLVTFGLAMLIGTCNVFLRDIERLVSILLMLWFYMTPVLFKPDMVPERFRWVNYANPMAAVIISWRSILQNGDVPNLYFYVAVVWGIVFCCAGYAVYRKLEWRFAELV